jgi:hypothetical protein
VRSVVVSADASGYIAIDSQTGDTINVLDVLATFVRRIVVDSSGAVLVVPR